MIRRWDIDCRSIRCRGRCRTNITTFTKPIHSPIADRCRDFRRTAAGVTPIRCRIGGDCRDAATGIHPSGSRASRGNSGFRRAAVKMAELIRGVATALAAAFPSSATAPQTLVRTAVCVEARLGTLHVFMPPVGSGRRLLAIGHRGRSHRRRLVHAGANRRLYAAARLSCCSISK